MRRSTQSSCEKIREMTWAGARRAGGGVPSSFPLSLTPSEAKLATTSSRPSPPPSDGLMASSCAGESPSHGRLLFFFDKIPWVFYRVPWKDQLECQDGWNIRPSLVKRRRIGGFFLKYRIILLNYFSEKYNYYQFIKWSIY